MLWYTQVLGERVPHGLADQGASGCAHRHPRPPDAAEGLH